MIVIIQNTLLFLLSILGLITGRLVVLIGRKNTSPTRILIVRTDQIGDLVLFIPFLRALRSAFPSHKISLVVRDLAGALFQDCPYVDEVITFRHKSFKRNLFYRLRFLWRIRGGGYGMVLNPMSFREVQGDQMVAWTSSQKRIGFDTRHPNMWGLEKLLGDRCYSQLVKYPLELEGTHELAMNSYFLHSLDVDNDPEWPHLWLTEGETALAVDKHLGGHDWKRIVSFFVDSSDPHRSWPAEASARLVARVLNRYPEMHAVILGILPVDLNLSAENKSATIINLTGRTTLREACAIVRVSSLVVANETGAIHLAAALGTRSISITGGGHFGVFVPYPKVHLHPAQPVVVKELMSCYNCRWRCIYALSPGSPYPCIDRISVDQVFNAVVELLGPKR